MFIILIIFLIILLFFIIRPYRESFNSDANFNPLFLMDQNYMAFDNLYDPHRQLYESINYKEGTDNSVGLINNNVLPYTRENIENKLTKEQKKLITTKNPYMFTNKLNIIRNQFYNDWRYPEMPIDVNFAINPDEYCSKYSSTYPCYKYFSRWK